MRVTDGNRVMDRNIVDSSVRTASTTFRLAGLIQPDGLVGTGDDTGRTLTYFDYPAAYAGALNSGLTKSTPRVRPGSLLTIEVAANKRFSQNWTLSSSFRRRRATTTLKSDPADREKAL